jgi:hypothetical protein
VDILTPVQFFRNMQYVFVAYSYDLNAILVHGMPSKTNGTIIAALPNILADLNACRYSPMLNVIMNNECSKAIEAHIQNNHMDIHLVPPHNHRVNAANHAIATFKEHFISALATVDKNARSNSGMISSPRWY